MNLGKCIPFFNYAESIFPLWIGMATAGVFILMVYIFIIDTRHKGRYVMSVHYHKLVNAGFMAYIGGLIGSFVTLNLVYFW